MARSIHVRLDERAQDALGVVRATEGNDSDAVRAALHEAAQTRRRRGSLRAEAGKLAADPDDAREMSAIREQMAAFAPDDGV
jgi:Arc/MetJ-type ribon-helix-helix transcriptional regulator